MAKPKIKLNSREVGKLLKSADVSRGMEPIANAVRDRAKATAPVRTGRYRDSIHVETETTDRVKKRIGSDVPYGMVVEARTGNLTRALDAAGGASSRTKFNPAP